MIKNRLLITLILCSLTLFSCKEEEEQIIDYAVISGTVDNSNDGSIFLSNTRTYSLDTLKIKNGSFHDTIKVEVGHYNLIYEGSLQLIYLEPGFKLKSSFDAENFGSTLAFSGTAAEINNYILEKAKKQNKFREGGRTLYELNEEEFKQKVKEQKNLLVEMLQNSNLSEDFKQREERNIHYAYITDLKNYNYFQLRKDSLYVPSDDFMVEIKEVDYENAKDYLFSSDYRNLVRNHFSEEAEILEENDSISRGITYLKVVGNLQNDTIRNSLLYGRARYGITFANDLDAYYHTFMGASTNEEHKDAITESYNKLKKVAPGQPSPQFVDYENYEGGVTSLTDFKGKYVYIDVWATWCGPCIGQMPFLKKIEEEFKDKNIEFVSISIDAEKDKDKWRKMIEDKELGGVQLFADNAFNSQFISDYQIKGIPQFILIDPKGNIVKRDAPRPSDPKLIELFDSLNI